MKSLSRRGQAWVVFKSKDSAREALSSRQNFPLFDKPMTLQYAKAKSDVIAKADGTFVPRQKNALKQDPTKRKDPGAGDMGMAIDGAALGGSSSGAGDVAMGGLGGSSSSSSSSMAPAAEAPKLAPAAQAFFKPASQPAARKPAPQAALPGPTLFVQDLPAEATEDLLKMLFGAYQGFREVRYIPSRHCAFVDYTSTESATSALRSLTIVEIRPGQRLNLTYAKV